MTPEEFENTIHNSARPIIVYFWAPWCIPCRSMSPILQEVAAQFCGQVDLVKIDADQSADLIRSLNVFSIPTLSAYVNGKLLFRRTGARNAQALREIFTAAAAARKPTLSLTPLDRLLRLGSGTALFFLSLNLNGLSRALLMLLGAALMFSAVYDRCPIYRAISARVKTFLKRRHFRSMI